MSLQKDISSRQSFKQILKDKSHLHFNTQQSTIKKINSLRKFDSHQPTFTPSVHQLPFQIYPERTKTQVSKQQIIERLLDDRREKAESLRAQKIRIDQKQYSEQCTFQPAINIESKRIFSKQSVQSKLPHQRLYEEGLSRIKNMNECTHLTNEEDKQNCTFQPNIGKQKPQYQSCLAPIYQRLEQIINDKKQSLKRLQHQQYQSQTREKPDINYKTKQIIQKKSNFKKNVLQRLFNHLKQKNNRLQQLAQQRKEQIDKQCPFQPIINYHSDSLLQGDFLQRQERQAEKARQNKAYLRQIDQATFQPSINKLSALLIEAQRIGESEAQRIDRLHCQPFLERKAQMQRIQQQIYKECTFQPQINALSKGLQGIPHAHRCACHPKQQHYQFHPQINPKSRQLAQKIRPKQEGIVLQHARLQQQYKQMRQCTFHPKTLGDRYKSTLQKKSLKQIPGANSYQQRIQKAKTMKKQQEKLKQKLFSIQKRYVQHKQTKPEPFNLSTGPQKISKLKQSVQDQFRKQHPFKPQTYNRIR